MALALRWVFCTDIRTDSDFCFVHYKLIGFYNRGRKCLLRGTNWFLIYSRLHFVFKRLNFDTISSAKSSRFSISTKTFKPTPYEPAVICSNSTPICPSCSKPHLEICISSSFSPSLYSSSVQLLVMLLEFFNPCSSYLPSSTPFCYFHTLYYLRFTPSP